MPGACGIESKTAEVFVIFHVFAFDLAAVIFFHSSRPTLSKSITNKTMLLYVQRRKHVVQRRKHVILPHQRSERNLLLGNIPFVKMQHNAVLQSDFRNENTGGMCPFHHFQVDISRRKNNVSAVRVHLKFVDTFFN